MAPLAVPAAQRDPKNVGAPTCSAVVCCCMFTVLVSASVCGSGIDSVCRAWEGAE